MSKFGKILVELIMWPVVFAIGWLTAGVIASFILWENVLGMEMSIMILRSMLVAGLLYGAVRAVFLVRAGKI